MLDTKSLLMKRKQFDESPLPPPRISMLYIVPFTSDSSLHSQSDLLTFTIYSSLTQKNTSMGLCQEILERS